MTQMQAIPTPYNGYRFRSRLEANWAAMFDLLEWPWLYEPVDLNGYIPDFILQFPYQPLLVEVKPALEIKYLRQHSGKIEASGWSHDYLIVGAGPFDPEYAHNRIGLISEWNEDFGHNSVRWLDDAILFKCLHCKQYSALHCNGWWVCRRCGHYDGDGHIDWIGADEVKSLWGQAHSRTQYQHRK